MIRSNQARLFAENFDARLAAIVIWPDCPLFEKKQQGAVLAPQNLRYPFRGMFQQASFHVVWNPTIERWKLGIAISTSCLRQNQDMYHLSYRCVVNTPVHAKVVWQLVSNRQASQPAKTAKPRITASSKKTANQLFRLTFWQRFHISRKYLKHQTLEKTSRAIQPVFLHRMSMRVLLP